MLIYIHGFNSSALSFKAALLRKQMALLRRSDELVCPDLPPAPREAIALLECIVRGCPAGSVSLIGSSLGAYYATWLAEHHGCRAVLVNPAVRPYELLGAYVGPQVNLYTGKRYELTHAHIGELRELEVDRITTERYLLLVQTGDEVLDYRRALERYAGATQMVIEGGNHGFSDFERYIDTVLAFCNVHSNGHCRAHAATSVLRCG